MLRGSSVGMNMGTQAHVNVWAQKREFHLFYTPRVSMAKWTEHKNVWVLIVVFCASFSYYIESFGLILTEPRVPPHAFAKYLFKCGVSQFCLSHMWKCTLGRQKRHMIFVDPQHVKSGVVFNTDQVYTFFSLEIQQINQKHALKT